MRKGMWLYKTVRKYFGQKIRENISNKGKASVAIKLLNHGQ